MQLEQPDVEVKQPLINCHTHIFTSAHVPPWLARTYLWWPFYLVLHLPAIVFLLKHTKKTLRKLRYSWLIKSAAKMLLAIRYFFYSLGFAFTLLSIWVTIQVFFFLYDIFYRIISPDNKGGIEWIENSRQFLQRYKLLLPDDYFWTRLFLLLFLLLFVKWGRNLIIFIFKKLWKFFGMLPGKQTAELLKRYLNIGWYSAYQDQFTAFSRLRGQYPPGSQFVVLPMDMEFMGAGNPKASYRQQMADLKSIKDNHPAQIFPFVFIDPRRIIKEGTSFFSYALDQQGRIQLTPGCFIQEYIEQHQFSGFKIYPALGYYPFDEALLPLWLYAQQHNLPIMTHCIRGTIFYRGRKKNHWNQHPVFEQPLPGGGAYEPMLLPHLGNVDFSNNFTHPLNYLCLLDERLLRILVEKSSASIQQIFGFSDPQTPLKQNLSQLKICFGHYGGDDEWERYLEKDRDNMSAQLIRYPDRGIRFLNNIDPDPATGIIPQITKQGNPEKIWKETDWYSIISSMMLQYENIFGDISYIIHDTDIFPLLKASLHPQSGRIRERILFGTDFYVVRNHKSERHMLADTIGGLDDKELDLIARKNPGRYLSRI
jgi:hypothetical protein